MATPHSSSAGTYIELTPDALKVLAAGQGLEMGLERAESGRLTPACRERVVAGLREFFDRLKPSARQQVFCGISGRGVSLRRLTVPAASAEELQRVMLLQIEREFPLPPAQIAWGAQPVNGQAAPRNGAPKTQQMLVAAIKRDLLQDYADMLAASGLKATFSVAALARLALMPSPPESCLLVELGRSQAEIVKFEHGNASSLRTVSRGNSLSEFAKSLESGSKIYVAGESDSAAALIAELGSGACELIDIPRGAGCSAATLGLAEMVERQGCPPLTFDLKPAGPAKAASPQIRWKWAAIAVALGIVCFGLRYAEALRDKPRLVKRIAEMKAFRDKLPNVDRELAFLTYLKTNQPAYLEALTLMAEASPGVRIESLSMNRHGDMNLRASMRDAQQVGDFRSKLIRSELFTSVVVEEQTPGQQKVMVRIAGQWKPSGGSAKGAAAAKESGTGNPKPEIRNPKEVRSPKPEARMRAPETRTADSFALSSIRISDFGFLSGFGFRISDFSTPFTSPS